MNLCVLILAAGKGTRMYSNLPKVLQLIAKKPLLQHVLDTIQSLPTSATFIIYGYGGDQVKAAIKSPSITCVEQKEQFGTGHAVMQSLPFLKDDDRVLILAGDVPFISAETLSRLINATPDQAIGWLTAQVKNPVGLGRIVRDALNQPVAIVEEKDAREKQKNIHEINTGICLIPVPYLRRWLPELKNNNAQKEYYLTDLFSRAVAEQIPLITVEAANETEILGINTPVQLAECERLYQRRQADLLMTKGLTLIDPARFDIRGELTFSHDVTIDINVILEGIVKIGHSCYIGPNVCLKNVTIGDQVKIEANSVIEDAIIENECVVGPFARIRPGTVLHEKAKIGNFVEIKKSHIGKNSKVNHLSYVGDTLMGEHVNVGAGTITCNYDGVNKFQTIIENDVFIGSNTALVAPITLEEGSTIGAGSVVARNTPKHKLTLARARQTTLDNWQRPKKQEKGN